jgi:hypothetical protein
MGKCAVPGDCPNGVQISRAEDGLAACAESLRSCEIFEESQTWIPQPSPSGEGGPLPCFSAGAGRVRGDFATTARPHPQLRGAFARKPALPHSRRRSRRLYSRSQNLIWTGLAIILAAITLTLTFRGNPAWAQSQTSHRVDIPFTRSIVTPHIPWDLPSAGSPIHAFVVPGVSSGRTLIELAERIPLNFHTVMIDEAWDTNTYIGFDQDYEARTYPVVYQYLTQDLTSSTPYDVIVIPSLLGWNRLPPEARAAIRRRVKEGEGLVLVHPTTGITAPGAPQFPLATNELANPGKLWPGQGLWNLSPLVGVESDEIDAGGARLIPPDAVAEGPWRIASENFIDANLPLAAFPYHYLKHYKYRLSNDSRALIVGEHGEPIIAVKQYGKGRVVALGYVNTGLSPLIDWSILGKHSEQWWEYFYSLLGRSMIWAARKEPSLTLASLSVLGGGRTLSVRVRNLTALTQAEISATLVNGWGEKQGAVRKTLRLRRGDDAATLKLPQCRSMGRHEVDVILAADGKHYDWGSATFDVPQTNRIVSISTDKHFYARGESIHVSFKTESGGAAKADSARVELWDNRGRLIGVSSAAADSSGGQATLKVGNYLTNIGWVRVTLLSASKHDELIDRKQIRVNFGTIDRKFGAYELVMPWGGPPSYQPWTPTLDAQIRKIGVSVYGPPERNFKMIASLELSSPKEQWFGAGWNARGAYIKEKDKFLETHDTRYLIRYPDLADDAELLKLRNEVRTDMKKFQAYHPIAYYLADETSLTSYEDPFDFSWSRATLVKFRRWLKTQYPSLQALNREWESHFTSWDEVMPLYTSEAQAKGDYAGWMDHRTFMERVFTHTFQVAAEELHRQDPDSLASISGTQVPGPSNGINWYLLDHVLDYLQPYSDDDQDELHRTMRPGLLLTGFTGYASHGEALRWQLWHRLFHGQTGASLFWQYTAVNPDLTLSEQGRDLEDVINEFRHEGLALLLHGANRENCKIAVHYSLSSVKGEWITDGHISAHEVVPAEATSVHLRRFHANRHGWLQALEDAGYQYDFLTTEQIGAGKLRDYRVLILPDSIALTNDEVAAIRQFVRHGGLLLTDAETGLMDGHGRWQAGGRLDDLLGVKHQQARTAPDVTSPASIRVNLGDEILDLHVLLAQPALSTTTGHAYAESGNTPLLIERRFGRGRAITLNFWMKDYVHLRQTGASQSRLQLVEHYLHGVGIRPVVDVRAADGKPAHCSERIAYNADDARYLAVIPNPYGMDGFPDTGDSAQPRCTDPAPLTVTLPKPYYVYDLRAHRYLGHLSRFTESPSPGSPMFLALEPSPIGHLSVTAEGANGGSMKARPGDRLYFSIRLSGQSNRLASACPVDVQVRNAAGKILDYYRTDLLLKRGAGVFSLPLALNDAPGRWQLIVREPFTRRMASATFTVDRGQ